MKCWWLNLIPLLLCQCGSVTVVKPDGTLIAHEGILDEADGSIFEVEMPNGTRVTRIISKPNRTRVAGKIVDGKLTLGLAGLWKDERVSADNNATKIKGQQLANEAIPLNADAEAKVINAKSAAAVAEEQAKQP